MAKAHSFKITLSNNRTESEGLDFVLRSSPDLFHPDVIGRKVLLKLFGLETSYLRAFDAIRISGVKPSGDVLELDSPKDITLIELKTTKKRLPDNPYGFFFGATENEFKLAKTLGKQFNFAFVCLHPECPSVKFLTLQEIELLSKKQRVQFQINFHTKPKA